MVLLVDQSMAKALLLCFFGRLEWPSALGEQSMLLIDTITLSGRYRATRAISTKCLSMARVLLYLPDSIDLLINPSTVYIMPVLAAYFQQPVLYHALRALMR